MLKSAQGTRAASFSAKIRNLQEYHNRLLNSISPLPSSVDIINVLKFFSQAILTILRDIPCLPIDLIRDPSRDSVRINFFPNLDYRTLYYALAQMLDSFASIQSTLAASAPVVFDYLLHAVVCLVPFLEHELMDSMPMTVANMISLNFVSHQDIIDMLCYNILPFTLYHEYGDESSGFANASIPSILMVVLSHTDSLSLHSQLLECLMRLKRNIIQDLLVVIAYGTGKSRHAAVELLFQYWPGLNPSALDRRTLSEKHVPWKPLTCQSGNCQNSLNNEAVKICFASILESSAVAGGTANAALTTDNKGRPPIPLLICIDCAEQVREQSSMAKSKCTDVLFNVLHPMTEICYSCEGKNCLSAAASKHSTSAMAVVTCFGLECTSYNSNKPVRLCAQCHAARHLTSAPVFPSTSTATASTSAGPSTLKEAQTTSAAHHRHLVQEHLQTLWQLPPDAQQHFTEAVISLLREASVLEKSSKEGGSGARGAHGLGGPYMSSAGGGGPGLGTTFSPGGIGTGGVGAVGIGGGFEGTTPSGPGGLSAPRESEGVDSTIEERQLLSRYGIWLLIGLCDPAEANTTERMELLGRMLAMLCQWFHNTACLPDDQAGSALERIKSESIHGWLMKVIDSQFQLFANCLIPNPPDYAQIGGHWESWPSMTIQIKEGFKRLLCLVPYDIITADIWAYIMPFWMESFRYDLPEMELAELKILLSKVLDPDLSPLGLPPKQMYHFISICFENMPMEQEQALSWLQILTLLEIPVPINLLNTMFQSGIKAFVNLRELKECKKVIETDLTDIGDEGLTQPIASTSKLSPNRDSRHLGLGTVAGSHPLIALATIENIVESQLACYVLMLDILLKQFELQEVSAHKGVDTGKDSSNTMQLLHNMISVANCTTPSGQVHTCGDFASTLGSEIGTAIPVKSPNVPSAGKGIQRHVSKPNSFLNACFFCELSSIWYQLSLQLITYFAPLVEMTVMPDIAGSMTTDTDSNPCLSPLSVRQMVATAQTLNGQIVEGTSFPIPPLQCTVIPPGGSAEERTTLYSINEDQAEEGCQPLATDDGCDSFGIGSTHDLPEGELEDDEKMLSSVDLNMTEKLTIKFLQELEFQSDPDVIYHLLQCLKLLALHSGILNRMAQDEKRRKFFGWCQKRFLITNFWRLIQAEFSQIAQIAVPLVLHCIALPGGLLVYTQMVNDDFKHPDWCVRFATIERVCNFSQFLEQSSVKNSSSLQSALSSLIIHLIQVLDDVRAEVSERALLGLELMRASSLRLYVWCLELQFDLVIVDRSLVLNSLLQLFNHLSMAERRLLSWDFFLNRFDAMFLEAQLHIQRSSDSTLEINEPTRDLRNTNVHSETYKKKISRANEALAQTHLRRSLLPHHGRSSKSKESRHHLSFNIFGAGHSAHHAGSQQGSLTRRLGGHLKDGKDGKFKNMSSASSTSSAVNRKSSKLAALTGSAFPNNFFHETGQSKRDILQEELQMFNVVHRVLDDDICDQETIHLLVFLFMQFLSWPDVQHPTDEKALNRTQIIVLRHLNTLMGYSMSENQFFLTAYDLRRKSIFSSFLLALPDVLDLNLPVGGLLLPIAFPVLVFCPAGHRFVYPTEIEALMPNYSLWLLQPLLRLSWLHSLIAILYKHNYSSVPTNSKFIQLLVQIVMNTLEAALEHKCSPTEALLRRSKELKESFNVECGELETKTESISEEVADFQKASNRSTITVDIEDDMGTEAPDDLMINGKAADLPIAIDIEEDEFTQVDHSKEDGSIKGTDADSESSRKSSVSSTLKHHSEILAVTSSIGGPRRSSEPKKYFSHHSSASEDNESVNKSSAESIADGHLAEMSSQQQQLAISTTINNANGRADKDVDDESEVTSSTSSTTATGAGPPTPPSLHTTINCDLCACRTPPSAPPPIERLLPIGGELSESVRHSLSRRPYPSMINPSTPAAAPPPPPPLPPLPPPSSGATITGTNFERSEPYNCCCCYQPSITGCPVSSCCIHYQQTIEAYKKQHTTATRELSLERLLPIGPKPQVHQSSATSPRTGSSQQQYSHSSRSVERKMPDWSRPKPVGKLLIRQHTTIGPDEQNHRRQRGSHSSGTVIRGVLLSSKSMDSVPDNYKIKFERSSHKIQQQQQPKTISTNSNSASSSSIAGGEIVVTSSNPEETTFGISTSQQNIRTTRRSTSYNSEESICTPVKEQPPTFNKQRTSTSTACNGNFDETATESEQETSKSSKEPCKSKISLGSDTAISNGIDNGKQLGKKRAKKKSKKNKSSKSTPASTTNNTPSHQLHQQQVSSPTATTSAPSFVLGTDVESPVGDNEVFNLSQANTPDYVGSGKSRAMQSQPDSAKDTTSGRSNEASSSSNTDLTSNAFEMCTICGMPIEKFDEQELGLCLVALATFVHRDPSLAAPLLPNILKLASRYAIRHAFSWQIGSHVHLPGNTGSIARQFIRCTLHQLSSNGIFRQIFQSHISDIILFRSIAISLADFMELNQVTPLKELFESLMEDKQLPQLPQILHTLSNVATYFECVFMDYNTSQGSNMAASGLSHFLSSLAGASAPNVGASIVANQPWSDLMSSFEAYMRKLSFSLSHIAPSIHNLVPLMRVLLALFKIPGIGAHRSILDPVMKILTHIVQHSPMLSEQVRELCILCSRAYVRDRERLCIARTFALELVQALRFRTHLPDENILLLVQWALEDSGGTLPYSIAAHTLERNMNSILGHTGIFVEPITTNATEALRMHITELLDFIADVHALARIKSNFQGTSVHLNEETLGGHLKAGVAQFLALELTRASSGSDHRAITKYLPWLYSLPSLQQGPKEFLECISHVRLLSWLLLGSLQHTALMKCHPNQTTCLVSQPIPLEASTHIAEHVQAILAGFAEQSKASVLHMSALFYAFLLCQLWTVYCEQLAGQNPPGSDAAYQNILVLSDFWSKVTPGVLQLICHSKGEGFQQLADTVSLHFLSLMETLMECNSEILARLIPLWLPLFNSYQGQLSGNTRVRLQSIVSWPCPAQTRDDAMMISTILVRWLQRIQTKMSQIEMQSSTATQFYCI